MTSAAGCQTILPLDVGVKIPEDDPVRKSVEICDGLNYTNLYREYLRNWRKVDPVILFKLPVLGYMNGIYSGRGIEKPCRRDIRFMWIFPHRITLLSQGFKTKN